MAEIRVEVRRRPRGIVLIAFTLSLLLMLGCVGLSVDIGRMYIVRNESQSFCDAAALAAAWELNGTPQGVTDAENAARAVAKTYHFAQTAFQPEQITVRFSKESPLAFVDATTARTDPLEYWLAEVTTHVNIPMYLMPALTNIYESSIGASASAKRISLPGMSQFLPFAPYWQPPDFSIPGGGANIPAACVDPASGSITQCSPTRAPLTMQSDNPVPSDVDRYFGMVPARIGATSGDWRISSKYEYQQGGIYSLRGPGNITYIRYQPRRNRRRVDPSSMCPNDSSLLSAQYRDANGQPIRGFVGYDNGDANTIYNAVEHDDPIAPPGILLTIGEYVPVSTGGECNGSWCLAPGTMEGVIPNGIIPRIENDTDRHSFSYREYIDVANGTGGTGNGRRVVVVPIVTANCGTGYTDPHTGLTVPPCPNYSSDAPASLAGKPATENRVLGWAAFFLLPIEGDKPCPWTGGNGRCYPTGATNPICAEFIGPWTNSSGQPGASIQRIVLVQ